MKLETSALKLCIKISTDKLNEYFFLNIGEQFFQKLSFFIIEIFKDTHLYSGLSLQSSLKISKYKVVISVCLSVRMYDGA